MSVRQPLEHQSPQLAASPGQMVGHLGHRHAELRRDARGSPGRVRVALGDEIVPRSTRESNLTRRTGRLRPELFDRLSEQAAHPLAIEPVVGVGVLPEGAGSSSSRSAKSRDEDGPRRRRA